MKNFRQIILTAFLTAVTFIFISSPEVKAQDASAVTDNTSNTYQQDGPSLYVVVQRSDMCTMCEDNYDRWNKDVIGYYSGRPSIIFMNYDITNDKSIENSKADIDKYGLTELVNANKRPGRVLLIDPNTKQIVKMLDVDLATTDIQNYINEAAPMKNHTNGMK